MKLRLALGLVSALSLSAACFGQLTIPSDGSDGVLSYPGGSLTLDLSQAPTASWNTAAPIPGKGVYDPQQWAVVYKFSSVQLFNSNIYFQNHPTTAPVVWLVDGDVNIQNSTLWLQGSNQNGAAQSVPGPGGFRGGACGGFLSPSAGFGPGGGNVYLNEVNLSAGSHATSGTFDSGPIYGNPQCIPLIGGSGGSGRLDAGEGGGAGGGAILIAAKGTITINGQIMAYGGIGGFSQTRGGGAGGAVRLVANTINLPGNIYANGNSGGGVGRIRLEGNTINATGQLIPPPSSVVPPQTPQIWPTSTTPKLEIVSVGSQSAPSDPRANLALPDIALTSAGSKVVTVRAYNVPTDGSWAVQVRMSPRNGKESYATCTFQSGNQAVSLWQCTLSFDTGAAALISRAYKL